MQRKIHRHGASMLRTDSCNESKIPKAVTNQEMKVSDPEDENSPVVLRLASSFLSGKIGVRFDY